MISSYEKLESGGMRLEIITDNKRTEENMMALLKKQVDLDFVIVSDQAKFYQDISTKHGFKEHTER